jgi:hypothetical protein
MPRTLSLAEMDALTGTLRTHRNQTVVGDGAGRATAL